jgi:hypothetical protein
MGKRLYPTSPWILQLLTERHTSRRQPGKGRIKHGRLDVTALTTARKSGNSMRWPATTLNNDA